MNTSVKEKTDYISKLEQTNEDLRKQIQFEKKTKKAGIILKAVSYPKDKYSFEFLSFKEQ